MIVHMSLVCCRPWYQIVLLFDVQTSMESASCKVIIDCDPGEDDAQAIIMLLAQQHIQVVGVTTVFGNEPVESTAHNAVRVLTLCNRLDVSCKQFLQQLHRLDLLSRRFPSTHSCVSSYQLRTWIKVLSYPNELFILCIC